MATASRAELPFPAHDLRDGSSGLSQAEQIAKYIDRLIGQGVLSPGDVLNEVQLSRAVGSSRVPVREAIRLLAGEGLVELQPRRSARIRPVEQRHILEMLEVLTQLAVLAIQKIGRTPLPLTVEAEMTALATRIDRASAEDGGHRVMHLISQFHYSLICWSGIDYLLTLVRRARVNYYLRYLVELVGADAILGQRSLYPRIVADLRAGRPDDAVRALSASVSALIDGCTASAGEDHIFSTGRP